MRPSIAAVDVFALLVMVLILLPQKPDVAQDDATKSGSVVIEAHWADGSATDVDLWCRVDGDAPVGYSRLRGRFFSLFRDDLGVDKTVPWRYEICASRSIEDGEYQVNLHAFREAGTELPLPVTVTAWYRAPGAGKVPIWQGVIVLRYRGEEVTAVRWRMRDGRMVPGSIHHTFSQMRSALPPL